MSQVPVGGDDQKWELTGTPFSEQTPCSTCTLNESGGRCRLTNGTGRASANPENVWMSWKRSWLERSVGPLAVVTQRGVQHLEVEPMLSADEFGIAKMTCCRLACWLTRCAC